MIITVGKVEDNDDPARAGRIIVRLSEMGDASYPEWVKPVTLGSFFFIPEIGDNVLILRPNDEDIIQFADEIYYLGRVLDQDDSVPDILADAYPNRRGFVTKSGHYFIVDDTEEEEEITFAHRGVILFSMTREGIFFGTKDASEPMVLGQSWFDMMSTLLDALRDHKHPTGTGPSGPPDNFATYQTLKNDLDNQLSDFVFSQKLKPTES